MNQDEWEQLCLSQQKKRDSWQALPEADKDRIVRLGWEDRTGFDAIQVQVGI